MIPLLLVAAAVGGSKTSNETERNGSTDESPEQGNGADHTLTEEVNNKVGTDSDEHDQVTRRRILAQDRVSRFSLTLNYSFLCVTGEQASLFPKFWCCEG